MVSSNWEVLQKELRVTNSCSGGTTKRGKKKRNKGKGGLGGRRQPNDLNQAAAEAKRTVTADERHEKRRKTENPAYNSKGGTVSAGRMMTTGTVPSDEKLCYLALDCEMVGVGNLGKESALAWCCIVNWDGEVVFDHYVRPKEFVTDFRTTVSGIESRHLHKAIGLVECQRAVAKIITDKIIVGHALKHDFKVLLLNHPRHMIRDTATYKPLKDNQGRRPRSLKSLSKEFLGRDIQQGKHSPGEDARAAMDLYKQFRRQWEDSLTFRGGRNRKKGQRS